MFLKQKSKTILKKEFDLLLPDSFQKVSAIHWTPENIIQKSAQWLAPSKKTKVLDIGSGVGKFCILGATVSEAHFTGVELRKNLVEESKKMSQQFNMQNIHFINKDIVDVPFSNYDSFYYYNPFCEYTAIADKIDDSILFSEKQLKDYNYYVFNELKKKPIGTRVVTYLSPNFQLPNAYAAQEILEEGALVFWQKIS